MLVYVMSLWRNDAERHLEDRATHLLSKRSRQHELRWLWIVGDCDDDTAGRLEQASVNAGHTTMITKPRGGEPEPAEGISSPS